MVAKTSLPKQASVLGDSGANGKTITGLSVYAAGSVIVIEIAYSGGNSFVKVKGLSAEVGGTNEWDTGTKVF